MPMVRAMRLLNAIEAGTTSGAQLQTLLTADPGRLAELNVLLGMRGQVRRMASSNTAMTAVAASTTAMNAVIANTTALNVVVASMPAISVVAASSAAMTAVAASSTAMATVAASNTAMNAVAVSATARTSVLESAIAMAAINSVPSAFGKLVAGTAGQDPALFSDMTAVAASTTAMTAVWASDAAADLVLTNAPGRVAVYNTDAALAALQFAPTQVQRQIGIGGRTTSVSTATYPFNFVSNGTRIIILRRWYDKNEFEQINWARGSTTQGAGHGPIAGSGGRTLYTDANATGCVSGTYNSNGVAPTSNTDTGNFVCAANGLRRNSSSNNATLSVIYITV